MSSYSPGIPSSFDPALLNSELEFVHGAPATPSYSDDIDAIQQCIAEDIDKKTRAGVVIQHRAWRVADVFRSEGEGIVGTAGVNPHCNQY